MELTARLSGGEPVDIVGLPVRDRTQPGDPIVGEVLAASSDGTGLAITVAVDPEHADRFYRHFAGDLGDFSIG